MKVNKVKKGVAATALTVALALGGGASAFAVESQTNFNSTVPRFQQSHYWVYQNKTTGKSSQVRFDSIGGGYLMNVKAENGATGGQYTEKKGIGVGSTVDISNGTPTGTATRLIVTNNSWVTVNVNVTGWFKTN